MSVGVTCELALVFPFLLSQTLSPFPLHHSSSFINFDLNRCYVCFAFAFVVLFLFLFLTDVRMERQKSKQRLTIIVDSLKASIQLSPNKTRVNTDNEQARALLKEIILRQCTDLSLSASSSSGPKE